MDKEREVTFESGFSEKQMDTSVDRTSNLNQVKANSIFDPKKKEKKVEVILDLPHQ